MDSTKPWYLSKTVWASLLVAIVGLLNVLGITHVGPIQVANMAKEQDAITDTAVNVVITVFGLIALWGRLTARTKLTS